tara:strand:+ start:282 stop:710 length:429 start_codon:yes stop_codon:yes gene_type:complete
MNTEELSIMQTQINNSIINLYSYKNNNNKQTYWITFLPLIFKILILSILKNELNNKNKVMNIFNQFTYFYKYKDDNIKTIVINEINNTNTVYRTLLNNKIGGNFKLNNVNDNLILQYNNVRPVNNPINIRISLINFLKLLNN